MSGRRVGVWRAEAEATRSCGGPERSLLIARRRRAALMTTPAAPVLSADGKHVKASFDAPKGSINAVIYLSSAKGKQFYDAENEMLLKVGQTGKVIKLTGNAKKSVHITNLEGDLEYTATIAFRGADDFDWGPTSPASAPLTIVPPVAPRRRCSKLCRRPLSK